jgi:hypothetical protein
MIYEDPDNRKQMRLLFNHLQLKYWQAICHGIEAKLPPREKKPKAACIIQGNNMRDSTCVVGQVVALDWNGPQGEPVHTRFAYGDEHHNSVESAAKLQSVLKEEASNDGDGPKPQDGAVPYSAAQQFPRCRDELNKSASGLPLAES